MASYAEKFAQWRDSILSAYYAQDFGPSGMSGQPTYYDPFSKTFSHNFHKGVDLVLPGGLGAPVRSPASGKVVYTGGYNNDIHIQTANGWIYKMLHFVDHYQTTRDNGRGGQQGTRITRVGDLVRAGDTIGHQGSEGYSTGPHLHLQVETPPVDARGTRYAVDLGKNVKDVFYTLYHSLGLGAGYNPSHEFLSAPPEPLNTHGLPAPRIPPPNNSKGYDVPNPPVPPGNENPPGTVDPPESGVDLLGRGVVMGVQRPLFSSVISEVQSTLPDAGASILMFATGVLFVIIGLRKLGNDKAVQVITTPVLAPIQKTRSKIIGAVKSAKNAHPAGRAATVAESVSE
jgi:hypothetical protein